MAALFSYGLLTVISIAIGLIFTIIGVFIGHIILFDSIFLAAISGIVCNQIWSVHPALCVIIAIAVLGLLFWLQKRLWLRANQRLPLTCVQATLVNHRQVYEGAQMSHYKASFLTFETEDGAQLEFEVIREEFDRIQIGAKGPLEYRGGMYRGFRGKRDEENAEAT